MCLRRGENSVPKNRTGRWRGSEESPLSMYAFLISSPRLALGACVELLTQPGINVEVAKQALVGE